MQQNAPPPVGWRNLEEETQTELHFARKVRCVGFQEGATPKSIVNSAELRVIEEVEVLPTEIKTSFLTELESLENTYVKVQSARLVESIATHVPEGETRGNGVRGGVVEQ